MCGCACRDPAVPLNPAFFGVLVFLFNPGVSEGQEEQVEGFV